MRTRRRQCRRAVALLTLTLLVPSTVIDVAGALTTASARTTEPNWGPVVTLDRAGQLSRPDVVVDGHGTATVAWSRAGSIVVTRRAAGGNWGPRVDLGQGSDPQLGIDRDGTVTIVWSRRLLGHGPQVMAARHPVPGRWSTPVALSPDVMEGDGGGAFGPVLGVSRRSAVVVSWLWNEEDSGAAQVQARYRPAASGWRAVITLSPVKPLLPPPRSTLGAGLWWPTSVTAPSSSCAALRRHLDRSAARRSAR